MKKSPLSIIFLTVFIDLVGFGMIIPLSPYLAREYGASALEVGLLLSVYSLMQIIFSPIWGKWSDRIGRRPIILVSLLGTGLSHVAFAYSGALWMLFVSRTLAGIFGANISTAMAYAADVTADKDRSKGMGLVGAAIALGFIFGPLFGGFLGFHGASLGDLPPFGHSFPALVAGLICTLNAFVAFFVLPESLPESARAKLPPRASKIKMAMEYFAKPVTGQLLMVTFLAQFSMAQMEASLFLLVKDKFDLGLVEGSYAFALVGVVIAFTQGFLLRKILPMTGERILLVWGTVISSVALGLVGFAPSILGLAVIIVAMSLGFGIRMPALNGSISMTCSAQEQGAVMGVNQSLQALGRVLGPALGGWSYGAFGGEVCFAIAGFCGILGLIFVWQVYSSIPDTVKPAEVAKPSPGMGQKPTAAASTAPVRAANVAAPAQPTPVVIPDRPRASRPPAAEAPKVEHVRKEDRITVISASQFRSLFTQNINFMFFDFRAADAAPQYSRAIKVTTENAFEELNKRTQDKRIPILLLCEDGTVSKETARKIADLGFINVVVVEGGARALNRTGHV